MTAPALLALLLVATAAGSLQADDRRWENPVFGSAQESVAAARAQLPDLDQDSSPALRLFLESTLAAGDVAGPHPSSSTTRKMIDRFLVTHRTSFLHDSAQRLTIERFEKAMPRQREVVEKRLARFGYPELPGLVYCRLVNSVDAFAGLGRTTTDKMSQVGGVTYYCRYIVLPLSYVGEQNLRQLRQSAALNPNLDFDGTVRRWQRESFGNLVGTFRHELVHVHTNSTLGVPAYSNRGRYPTWFHEGTATYLAGDHRAGLSERYKEYQGLFLYLVQRHGVPKLQAFFGAVMGGAGVAATLDEVYSISGADDLFARSGRWHRIKEVATTAFWIMVLVVVIIAFRGSNLPVIGSLLVLFGMGLAFAIATGLAEHLWGLHGPGAVLTAKLTLGLLAAASVLKGWVRIRRHRQANAA